MPNVASYPDFITGVADLKARMDKGEISQDSHNKLYADLINRFMKKESFETPWFLREVGLSVGTLRKDPQRVQNFLNYIKKGTPLFGTVKMRRDEILHSYANINVAKKILKWKPKISFKSLVHEMVDFDLNR